MYISTEQFDFRFEIDERGNSDGDTGLFFYIRYEKKCARILHNSRLCVCINLFCIVSARFRFSFLGSILAHFFSHFVFFLLLLHTAQFRIYHVLIIAQILPQYLKCFFSYSLFLFSVFSEMITSLTFSILLFISKIVQHIQIELYFVNHCLLLFFSFESFREEKTKSLFFITDIQSACPQNT